MNLETVKIHASTDLIAEAGAPGELYRIQILINGKEHLPVVKANTTLLGLLREELGIMGTKVGCDAGDCGACTVLVDDEAKNSCLLLAVEADGCAITTIEGLERNGKLDSVQEAFIQHGAVQCGYCTPGMVLSGRALLDRNANPGREEVREAIAGNLCRCTGYVKIVEAILAAAKLQVEA